jgi:chromate transport protein ChrA
VGFLVPPLLLQVIVARQWERLAHSPWIRALDRTLVPISVGLIAASLHALAVPLLGDPRALIGFATAAVVALVFRPAPALIVLGAGVLGVLGVL